MLRHTTQPANMIKLLMICALVQQSSAQSNCDPVTQYEKDGLCCRKCPPGTSMGSLGSCSEPVCTPCDDNEYQDTYTTSDKCQRQPYCDPNKNFKDEVHLSKTSRTTCLCKDGFHCSSEVCITCVAHRECPPGQGADPEGNQNRDTTCKQCQDKTFSDETSWNGTCRKWTECQSGSHISQIGTATSDNTCVPTKSHGYVAAIVIPLLIAILVTIGLLVKFKPDFFKRIMECGKKSHQPIEQQPNEVDNAVKPEVKVDVSIPEENEDDDIMSARGLTENGNVLQQEFGKTEPLSRQESQTEPFISFSP